MSITAVLLPNPKLRRRLFGGQKDGHGLHGLNVLTRSTLELSSEHLRRAGVSRQFSAEKEFVERDLRRGVIVFLDESLVLGEHEIINRVLQAHGDKQADATILAAGGREIDGGDVVVVSGQAAKVDRFIADPVANGIGLQAKGLLSVFPLYVFASSAAQELFNYLPTGEKITLTALEKWLSAEKRFTNSNVLAYRGDNDQAYFDRIRSLYSLLRINLECPIPDWLRSSLNISRRGDCEVVSNGVISVGDEIALGGKRVILEGVVASLGAIRVRNSVIMGRWTQFNGDIDSCVIDCQIEARSNVRGAHRLEYVFPDGAVVPLRSNREASDLQRREERAEERRLQRREMGKRINRPRKAGNPEEIELQEMRRKGRVHIARRLRSLAGRLKAEQLDLIRRLLRGEKMAAIASALGIIPDTVRERLERIVGALQQKTDESDRTKKQLIKTILFCLRKRTRLTPDEVIGAMRRLLTGQDGRTRDLVAIPLQVDEIVKESGRDLVSIRLMLLRPECIIPEDIIIYVPPDRAMTSRKLTGGHQRPIDFAAEHLGRRLKAGLLRASNEGKTEIGKNEFLSKYFGVQRTQFSKWDSALVNRVLAEQIAALDNCIVLTK